ncbi:hypothetical protein [Paraliomyxa miuraensis]|uniref:hypothetical protein n=1 Tax=Paraliomyxa miuraensis TaxID=376150 RepID=UPI002251772A|nr:hypothetical protein [Paraliomyxa miuraensis]MCX4244681.1 hypothetical protein [Paraliomyxa miuraensis]
MDTTACEASQGLDHALVDDGERLAPFEPRSLTAAVTGLCIDPRGRRFARLNAFVDGLGQRTVHLELGEHDHALAQRAMTRLGVLVRSSGELVFEGPRLLLRPARRLRWLEPLDDPR